MKWFFDEIAQRHDQPAVVPQTNDDKRQRDFLHAPVFALHDDHIVNAEGLEQAACRIGKGLRIHLRDAAPIPGIVGALSRRGDGEVSFLVPSDGGKREVEVRLRDRYAVSPEVANALRVLAGVTQVENL